MVSTRRFATALLAALLTAGACAPAARAAVYETQEQALARVFPAPTVVRRHTVFLTPEQQTAVKAASEAPLDSAVVTRYGAFGATGAGLGTAYFDQHVVRTAKEVLLVVVAPDGSVARVDVLAFQEPEDYLPRPGWLRRLEGKSPAEGLYVGRALAHVTGATLTTRSIAAAVRRVLAIHQVAGPVPTAGDGKNQGEPKR